jgi:lipoprotein-anchoring transpeptidase ErfK/SrfK
MRLLALLLVVLVSNPFPASPAPAPDSPFPDKETARIVISQDEQRLTIYDGDRPVRQLPVSTGWPGVRKTTTPTWTGPIGEYWGTFSSFGTTQDFGYWLFTDYLPDGSWNGDILIHGAPYVPGPAGEKVYSRDHIGFAPRSHGCIQLLPEDAEWFRAWDPLGVGITIAPFSRGSLDFPKLGFGARLAASPPQGEPPAVPLGLQR